MASSERSPVASRRCDLCRHTVHLLRKMRSDVCEVLDAYVQKQGLDKSFNLDSVDGVPTASTEQWGELSDAERLQENLKAYWAFQVLLDEILEVQRSHLTPSDDAFHKSIEAIILQVSALAYQLEQLLVTLEHSVPAREFESKKDALQKNLFHKKLKGMKVLQELAHWNVRSIRDLHQVSKSVNSGATIPASDSLGQT
uniref:Ciliary neurotrophic factor n=1 Tax=Salvator merianae TaxID=96440 RepID=A0A8D0B7A0_SALMN